MIGLDQRRFNGIQANERVSARQFRDRQYKIGSHATPRSSSPQIQIKLANIE